MFVRHTELRCLLQHLSVHSHSFNEGVESLLELLIQTRQLRPGVPSDSHSSLLSFGPVRLVVLDEGSKPHVCLTV